MEGGVSERANFKTLPINLIARKRKQAKISQKELAQKIGTTQSNVARMEAGNQNFSMVTLEKIAEALNSELKVSFLRK